MADIEAMFYQVRVIDAYSTYLRFLWWPNGRLDNDLEEYQMVVHLFGASSPACSNVARITLSISQLLVIKLLLSY